MTFKITVKTQKDINILLYLLIDVINKLYMPINLTYNVEKRNTYSNRNLT
jgi:hypothetical protein